jgi:hypothetical protein
MQLCPASPGRGAGSRGAGERGARVCSARFMKVIVYAPSHYSSRSERQDRTGDETGHVVEPDIGVD